MCFSSLSIWWLPCGANEGILAGWPEARLIRMDQDVCFVLVRVSQTGPK